jgi:hypothetical protein
MRRSFREARELLGAVLVVLALAEWTEPQALAEETPWQPVQDPAGPEYTDSTRTFQGIPGIERAANGRLWATWYGGGVGETSGNYVMLATRGGDDSANWSGVKLVINPDGEGPERAFDPCLWHDPLGRLWLFWAQEGGSRSGLWSIRTDDSSVERPSWSQPRRICNGVMMNKPLVLSTGDWLLPVAAWESDQSAGVFRSTDEGTTWERLGAARVPEKVYRSADEHMIVERKDGSLWMLVRTVYGLGESVSTDRGRTWSDVTPSPIRHETARFFLRRLASGKLLLVKHGPIKIRTKRSDLTAFLSNDDGRTWSSGLLLDERKRVSYPDGIQAPDGTIHIIYDYSRYKAKEILLATFREEDVAAGEPVSGRVQLRTLINKATGAVPPVGQLKTAFFVDWWHVYRGTLQPTFNPNVLTEAAKVDIERGRKKGGMIADLSGHGMKRLNVPFGVRITQEKAQKTEPWLHADRPWERSIGGYATVLDEDGTYRCWYQATLVEAAYGIFPEGIKFSMHEAKTGMAYAESVDGFHWTKPDLDVYTFEGQPTNIVSPFAQTTGVFRDDSPGTPPSERYKCFDWDRLPNSDGKKLADQYGLYGCVSPDGFHWTRRPEPILPFFHDTQNIAAWDPHLEKYVGYFRGHLGGRAVARSETDDFRNWPPARTVLCRGPEDPPFDDYYSTGFTVHPGDSSLRFLFPAIYHHDSDKVDVRMAVSRDNISWNWMSHEPIIDLGEAQEWHCGSIYAGPNLLHLPDGRLALPISASQHTHNEDYPYSVYPTIYHLGWATWKQGRLAGIEARQQGEFWMRSLGAFAGGEISINARTTRSGRVDFALHEKRHGGTKPVPGYTFDDCVPFRRDETWTPLRWKNGWKPAELKGKELVLHFRLKNATVFGCRYAIEGEPDKGVGLRRRPP